MILHVPASEVRVGDVIVEQTIYAERTETTDHYTVTSVRRDGNRVYLTALRPGAAFTTLGDVTTGYVFTIDRPDAPSTADLDAFASRPFKGEP